MRAPRASPRRAGHGCRPASLQPHLDAAELDGLEVQAGVRDAALGRDVDQHAGRRDGAAQRHGALDAGRPGWPGRPGRARSRSSRRAAAGTGGTRERRPWPAARLRRRGADAARACSAGPGACWRRRRSAAGASGRRVPRLRPGASAAGAALGGCGLCRSGRPAASAAVPRPEGRRAIAPGVGAAAGAARAASAQRRRRRRGDVARDRRGGARWRRPREAGIEAGEDGQAGSRGRLGARRRGGGGRQRARPVAA